MQQQIEMFLPYSKFKQVFFKIYCSRRLLYNVRLLTRIVFVKFSCFFFVCLIFLTLGIPNMYNMGLPLTCPRLVEK